MTYLVVAIFVLIAGLLFAWLVLQVAMASTLHVAKCIEEEDLPRLSTADCNLTPKHWLESGFPTAHLKAVNTTAEPAGALLAREGAAASPWPIPAQSAQAGASLT